MHHSVCCFALGCLILPATLAAQALRGRVVAESTAIPIEGADVVLRASGGREHARVVTGADGGFTIRIGGDGTWVLDVSRIGFASWVSEPFDLDASDALEIEIRLGVEAVPLEPIRVMAAARGRNAEFRRRMLTRSGTGRFIGRARIDRATSLRTSDLLRTVPGLTVVPLVDPRFPGIGATRFLIRGRQGCPVAVFVDGLHIPQGELSTVDELTDPRRLDGVEIYDSEAFAPTQFRTGGGCGVVLFWTRPPEPSRGRFHWKRFGVFMAALGAMIFFSR